MKNIILFFFLIVEVNSFAQSENCTSEEAKQFNFWLGEWKVEWTDSTGKKFEGSNIINSILGGCVIEENFNGEPGIPFKGKSFSVYSPRKNKWQQTWVDNSGGYMIFEGEFKNDEMILYTERIDKNNNKLLMRMVFSEIEENSLVWDWQRSTDQGKNWQNLWRLFYTRM